MRNKYLSFTDNRDTTPFESSEEAWFWYCLCENLGFERGHNQGGKIARPCETSDIILAVKRLLHQGLLSPEHIHILHKYGTEQAPPHINFGATQKICRLWKEAMEYLDSLLRKKGIVRSFLFF
ncbi:MAG: hypothetical protein SPL08_05485 [Pseudomonadota bacterium]|nr:hypothetical protein [Pseudomonadota bacterium]